MILVAYVVLVLLGTTLRPTTVYVAQPLVILPQFNAGRGAESAAFVADPPFWYLPTWIQTSTPAPPHTPHPAPSIVHAISHLHRTAILQASFAVIWQDYRRRGN